MEINRKISYYKGKIITDSEIMKNIGVVTYSYLAFKFPAIFRKFKECDELYLSPEGHIPSHINLYISDNPFVIKSDLIKIIHGEEPENIFHRNLIDSSDKPQFPLLEKENSFYEWIFICIVMIILIFLAMYVIYKLDKTENII